MMYNTDSAWSVSESAFNKSYQGKYESIFCLGNGYMGIRSSHEESYTGQTRGMFIAGTFNRFGEAEVSELPNAADLISMDIRLNGEELNLETGKTLHYNRSLNLKSGLLERDVKWESPKGIAASFRFERFVSLANLHTLAQRVTITPDADADIIIRSGINGAVTNSGTQHFSEGEKRFYDKKYLQYVQTTTQHRIDFVFTSGIELALNSNSVDIQPFISMERRKLFSVYTIPVKKGESLTITKISYAATSFDKEYTDKTTREIQEDCLAKLKVQCSKGYNALFEESCAKWDELVWDNVPITIESDNNFDQLAIRFAQYHLQIMAPAHDSRLSIAAKGLSGEGYKGHTFWDNEIFTLPYFTFTQPQIARSMCLYRFLSLEGAHNKAKANGLTGAMYPWESARLEEGEVTPIWGAADIVTGEPIKIWSGFIQLHISADVAFGIWQYYMMTGDKDFMQKYGYEVILDTAIFWASRFEYDENDSKYHINGVMGPDEYKEHIDDNAFTNYMAHWNIKRAMESYTSLMKENPELFDSLNKKLDLDKNYNKFIEIIDKIYLPQPRQKDLVVPQDKTYLSKKDIDLTIYKNQKNVCEIFRDYNLVQVNGIQVSKQADIMILFLLLEDLFSADVKKANWDYYEPRTLHDSSLSLSTHAILAADMKDRALATDLFNKCVQIDLGENMKSSDAGIHTASIGGMWQVVVYGFGGVRMINGKLRISPILPDAWKRLHFYFYRHGQRLSVDITHDEINIKNLTGTDEIALDLNGEEAVLIDEFRKSLRRVQQKNED